MNIWGYVGYICSVGSVEVFFSTSSFPPRRCSTHGGQLFLPIDIVVDTAPSAVAELEGPARVR